MRISKKLFCAALALVMAVSVMPMTVFAEDEDPIPKAYVTKLTTAEITDQYTDDFYINAYDANTTYDVGFRFQPEHNNDYESDKYYDNFVSKYRDWQADFVVRTDRDINAGAITIGGWYAMNGANWVGLTPPVTFEGNLDFRLFKNLFPDNYAGITYDLLCIGVPEFLCAAKLRDDSALGAVMTVELRLFNPDKEDDYVIINSFDYTFGKAKVGGTYYSSIEDAVAASLATETTLEVINDANLSSDDIEKLNESGATIENKAADNGAQLTLEEDIQTTMYVDVQSYAEVYNFNPADAVIKMYQNTNKTGTTPDYAKNEVTTTVNTSQDVYDGTYKFSFDCAPAQMTETYTIELYANDQATTPIYSKEYCAADFCKEAIQLGNDNPTQYGALSNLCKSLVDYGRAAQIFFDYNTAEMIKDDDYWNNLELFDANDITETNTISADCLGFSFDCTNELQVIIYFDGAKEVSSSNGCVYKDGTANDNLSAAPALYNTTNYVRVSGIASGNIGREIEVNFTDGTSVTFSVNAIVKAYLQSSSVSDSMKDLAKAIYNYGKNAGTFFA